MTPQEIDVIVRVAGATLLLAATILLSGRDDRRNGLFFLPLALCLCGFLAGNTPDAALRLSGMAGHAAYLLTGFGAVFLWWFCLSVFDRTFRPRGLVLGAGLAWMVIAAADRGLFGDAFGDAGLSRLLIILGLGMVAHLAWRLIRDRSGDLVSGRREARVLVVLLLGGQLLADLIIDVVMGFDWQPRAFSILQNAGLLVFTGWLLHLRLRASAGLPSAPVASGPAYPHPPAGASAEGDRLKARLRALVDIDRVHLDPDLTFDRFVSLMGAPDRTVRRLINHELGYDHFRTFLNAHRMIEARRRLADPAHRHDKLITVAMDSGFSSLASFNRVFQDLESCPPSVFRQRALAPTNQPAGPAGGPPSGFEERSADS
ncbi:MAG: AraC family transcriptional regulator [Pseudomonadota bacterium]|nr:AraC family transcriptional regulator [Pseudomonadota bacterium]